MVPAGSCVADVGTDAARLPRLLLRSGTARRCIATDTVGAGLSLAERLCSRELEAGSLELRRASGLAALVPDDGVDVLMLTGLGAHKMVEILGDDEPRRLGVRRLVLQPQTDPVLVRRWLLEHGYAVVRETMVRERGYDYVVLAADAESDREAWSGPLPLNDLLEAGPRLIHSSDPVVRDHWEREAQRLGSVASTGTRSQEQSEIRSRLQLAKRILAQLPSPRQQGD